MAFPEMRGHSGMSRRGTTEGPTGEPVGPSALEEIRR